MSTSIAPPLSWVKPEVDYALRSVREDIARFLESPDETGALNRCPQHLHQVSGALDILGLSGALGFCSTVERAFSSMAAAPRKSTVDTLDRAVLALKEFIDGLAKGEANAPIRLFPLYREVAGLGGRMDVSEKDLFYPDLTPAAPPHPAATSVTAQKLPAVLSAQRSRFQRGLLAVLRNPSSREGLKDMRTALEALDMVAAQLPPPRSLWWVAAGLIDALMHSGSNEAWSATARAVCAKLDLRMRDLAKGDSPQQDSLLRDTLYVLAKCRPASQRVRDIRQLYRLDSLFPEADLPGLMEFDMDWLGPALDDVRTRIQSIKDLWVAYVSCDTAALARMREAVAALKARIHDLGNVQLIRMIDVVAMVTARLPNPYPSQGQLMITEMASAFLLIENIVDHFTETPVDLGRQVEIMGGWLLDAVKGKSSGAVPEGLRDDLSQEASRLKLQTQVVREISNNLQQVEQVIDAYARDRSRAATLQSLSPLLRQIHGALSILGFDRAAEIQSQCSQMIMRCAQGDPAWHDNDLETVVEGLAGIGFCLDPCLRGLPPAAEVLDGWFARRPQPATETGAGTGAAPKPETGTPGPLPPPPATAAEAELLDIFLEEAREVLSALNAALTACRADPAARETLTALRRGFHTLKGSGRMVGLDALGEAAWTVERVLNRWLEQSWPATAALLQLAESASAAISASVDELTAGRPATIDVASLAALSGTLENGPPAQTAATETACDEVSIGELRVTRTLFEIYRKEALQHATAIVTGVDALASQPGGKASEALRIAVHTIASISRTAGFAAPAELAAAIESCLPHAVRVTAGDLQPLREAAARLHGMVEGIAEQRMPLPAEQTIAGLDTLRSSLQETSATALTKVMPFIEPVDDDALVRAAADRGFREQRQIRDDIDGDLLPVFIEEAGELLPKIGRDLRAWRAAPGAPEAAAALQRALHTVKGSARMAGAMRLGELAHLMESRVEAAIAAGMPTTALLDDIEQLADRLADDIDRLGTGASSPADTDAAAGMPAGDRIVAPDPSRAAEAPGSAVLRVPADTIDRLINAAGEIGVARSRIDGELRDVRQSLSELGESMSRLRAQLRELELQADSQMQSRRSVVAADRPEFDPLEFDRYTRLQELTRMMAESLHDLGTVQQSMLRSLGEADAAVLQQGRIGRELQQGLMRTRTLPFSGLEERLYRIARLTARELGKKVRLEIAGSHVELDRGVLERIAAPLEHLLRNAIAHGIEAPGARLAAGKTEAGEIAIALRQDNNEVIITVRDDGAGLDLGRLRARGLEKGLLSDDREPTAAELAELIYAPGLSTADAVTELSGRGIGMDVVRSEIAAAGGHISTSFEAGRGTTFTIGLPLTLAVTQAVLLRSGSGLHAIQAAMVEQVLRPAPGELADARESGTLMHRDAAYPLRNLGELLGAPASPRIQQRSTVLLLRSGSHRIALDVDELVGNREIVIKPIGPQLARAPGVTGATILPDGRVVLIINPVTLSLRRTSGTRSDVTAAPAPQPAAPLVMVVDDSLTVRKITGRLLEREGYRVLSAKDGIDALAQLQDRLPDVMLLDIEMPRMDGFELAARMRGDARTATIPIVMISSRTAEKHRNRAREIGVNAFLGKPYQEAELLQQLSRFQPATSVMAGAGSAQAVAA